MKQAVHPEYYDVLVSCVCGNQFRTGSTRPEIRVEICNACHPIFNGGQGSRILDTEGRIEKFKRRFGG
jgi:large subunit ribosomal protein L31